MKKVITAQAIQEARKTGLMALAVPCGALITPQALDDARSYGVALQREPTALSPQPRAPGPAETVPFAAGALQDGRNIMAAAPARAADSPRTPPSFPARTAMPFAPNRVYGTAPAQAAAPPPCPGIPPGFAADLIARQVAQHIGEAADMAKVSAVVNEVLAERGFSSSQPPAPGATPAGRPVRSGDGAVLVRYREALPDQAAHGDAVIVTDSLIPDAQGPGAGYLRFADTSFAWTFASDEVLIVLEGELRITGEGLDLRAGPGDALRLRAGMACTLSATGRVSCVYSAWPK